MHNRLLHIFVMLNLYTHVFIYTCFIYPCIHIPMYSYAHLFIYHVFICPCIHIPMYSYAHVFVCPCIRIPCIHIPMYSYIHVFIWTCIRIKSIHIPKYSLGYRTYVQWWIMWIMGGAQESRGQNRNQIPDRKTSVYAISFLLITKKREYYPVSYRAQMRNI